MEGLAIRRTRGKACTNCVRIKCKCIPLGDGSGCQRCQRLRKTCEQAAEATEPARVDASKPRRGTSSRSARLEAKLGDLVELLQSTQQLPAGRSGSDGSPGWTDEASSSEGAEPTTAESEDHFQRFRDEMLPLEPFVYLSPETTASGLRQASPFLWRCAVSAATPLLGRRHALGRRARQEFVARVVVAGERSLDLLLGTLVLAAWYHMLHFDRAFASMLAQMAVAQAWDLGLTAPPLLEPAAQVGGPRPFVPVVLLTPQTTAVSLTKRERSLEEMRAVLGVFAVTAMLAHMCRAADGLRWSPYLAACLAHPRAHSRLAQDAVLIQHVQMRHVVSQVRLAAAASAKGSLALACPALSVPLAYIEALKMHLDAVVGVDEGGNSDAFDNFSTHTLYHHAVLSIHETVLAKSTADVPSTPDLHRFDMYQCCLQSVRALLDRVFAWPLAAFPCLPAGIYSQLFHATVCLHKLTTLRDPAWSRTAARATLDVLGTLDRLLHIVEQLQTSPAWRSEAPLARDPLNMMMRKLQALRGLWQSEAEDAEGTEATATADESGVAESAGVDAWDPSLSSHLADYVDHFHSVPDFLLDLSWP